jgi:hypothetical protein
MKVCVWSPSNKITDIKEGRKLIRGKYFILTHRCQRHISSDSYNKATFESVGESVCVLEFHFSTVIIITNILTGKTRSCFSTRLLSLPQYNVSYDILK